MGCDAFVIPLAPVAEPDAAPCSQGWGTARQARRGDSKGRDVFTVGCFETDLEPGRLRRLHT